VDDTGGISVLSGFRCSQSYLAIHTFQRTWNRPDKLALSSLLSLEVIMLVDVCVGKMTLKEVEGEITHYIMKSPSHLIIDIVLIDASGYHTSIWIDKKTFDEKC
jgi:hypothetical protein